MARQGIAHKSDARRRTEIHFVINSVLRSTVARCALESGVGRIGIRYSFTRGIVWQCPLRQWTDLIRL